VEEVSLSGGYVLLGLNYGLYMAGKGVMKLAGARGPIHPASARPPPLQEAQLERAARLQCQADPACAGAMHAGD